MDDVSVERWLPVVGFEGSYEVSDWGRVRGLDRIVRRRDGHTQRIRGRVLMPCPDTHGYLQVNLLRSGKHTKRGVHVLVMAAFIGPRPPGMQIRHGPNGKLDNSLANLSYGTQSENQQDRRRDGTHIEGERSSGARLTEAIVRECRERYARGDASMRGLAREFQVSYNTMGQALRRTRWKHVT